MTVAVGRLHITLFLAPATKPVKQKAAPIPVDEGQEYLRLQTRRQLEDERLHWQYLRMISGGHHWV